ncbi:hypothetical protein KU43_03765 [Mesotoga sp. SC_NapDC2]|nr:hypothetical protein RM69_02905 [Mesotoga sp. SC_NapDC3]PXF33410.1 hypothetical protein EU77_13845 [Mesotoga sp. SC_NapDC]RIZ61252.1 hypothetical protein KU43_03765 [Mesotoga sp. SC_NapDC2]
MLKGAKDVRDQREEVEEQVDLAFLTSNLIHVISIAFSITIRFEMKAKFGNVDRRIPDVYCLRFCYHKNMGPFGPLL